MSEKNTYTPTYALAPGEVLLEHLEHASMSQAELSERLGLSRKHINKIVSGEAPIEPATAIDLESVFGLPANIWMGLEARYQESKARIAEASEMEAEAAWVERIPVRAMQKLKWIPNVRGDVDLVKSLREYFGVASLDFLPEVWGKVSAAYRKTDGFGNQQWALLAWLRQGEKEVLNRKCAAFDPARVKGALYELKQYSLLPEVKFIPPLVEHCSLLGIALVFVPAPPGAGASGAARWINKDKALIQLSLRYKTDDHLWFTFFHEVGHLLLHGKRFQFVDFDGGDATSSYELEANEFAATSLIPTEALDEFVRKNDFSDSAVRAFANHLRIAPGIVVGQLQKKEMIRWNQLNHLKRRFAWSETVH